MDVFKALDGLIDIKDNLMIEYLLELECSGRDTSVKSIDTFKVVQHNNQNMLTNNDV